MIWKNAESLCRANLENRIFVKFCELNIKIKRILYKFYFVFLFKVNCIYFSISFYNMLTCIIWLAYFFICMSFSMCCRFLSVHALFLIFTHFVNKITHFGYSQYTLAPGGVPTSACNMCFWVLLEPQARFWTTFSISILKN